RADERARRAAAAAARRTGAAPLRAPARLRRLRQRLSRARGQQGEAVTRSERSMAAAAPLVLAAPPLERPLLVGYSGGLDSTALLHLLATDAAARVRGVRAIHVHHGLHPDAGSWARHCLDTCRGLGVPL